VPSVAEQLGNLANENRRVKRDRSGRMCHRVGDKLRPGWVARQAFAGMQVVQLASSNVESLAGSRCVTRTREKARRLEGGGPFLSCCASG
jgi:hypothetical protein